MSGKDGEKESILLHAVSNLMYFGPESVDVDHHQRTESGMEELISNLMVVDKNKDLIACKHQNPLIITSGIHSLILLLEV